MRVRVVSVCIPWIIARSPPTRVVICEETAVFMAARTDRIAGAGRCVCSILLRASSPVPPSALSASASVVVATVMISIAWRD